MNIARNASIYEEYINDIPWGKLCGIWFPRLSYSSYFSNNNWNIIRMKKKRFVEYDTLIFLENQVSYNMLKFSTNFKCHVTK